MGFQGAAQRGGEIPYPSKPCPHPWGSFPCPMPGADQQEDVYGDSKWASNAFQTAAGRCSLAGLLPRANPWLKISQRSGCENLNQQDSG